MRFRDLIEDQKNPMWEITFVNKKQTEEVIQWLGDKFDPTNLPVSKYSFRAPSKEEAEQKFWETFALIDKTKDDIILVSTKLKHSSV